MMPRSRKPVLALVVLAVLGPAALPARGEFFLVAELPSHLSHHDSFVLPLTAPRDIVHARTLIARGPSAGASIVRAEIAAGADGINRDYLALGKPAWSWHVTKFLAFTDFTIEVYDGWPGYVQADVPGWMRNTGGNIGFGTYTVVAELGDLRQAPEPTSLALAGFGTLGVLAYCGWSRRSAAVSILSRCRRHAVAGTSELSKSSCGKELVLSETAGDG